MANLDTRMGLNRKSRERGRPSLKERFAINFNLLYSEIKFIVDFIDKENITITQLFESLIHMLKTNPKSFKLYDNPHINRKHLKPVESASA